MLGWPRFTHLCSPSLGLYPADGASLFSKGAAMARQNPDALIAKAHQALARVIEAQVRADETVAGSALQEAERLSADVARCRRRAVARAQQSLSQLARLAGDAPWEEAVLYTVGSRLEKVSVETCLEQVPIP